MRPNKKCDTRRRSKTSGSTFYPAIRIVSSSKLPPHAGSHTVNGTHSHNCKGVHMLQSPPSSKVCCLRYDLFSRVSSSPPFSILCERKPVSPARILQFILNKPPSFICGGKMDSLQARADTTVVCARCAVATILMVHASTPLQVAILQRVFRSVAINRKP